MSEFHCDHCGGAPDELYPGAYGERLCAACALAEAEEFDPD